MTDIEIYSVEVEDILRTQQPKEKYDALVLLFKGNMERSIDSHESTGSIDGEPEIVSNSPENFSPSDAPEVLSDSTEKLSSSDDVVALSSSDESEDLNSSDKSEALSDRDETPTPSENSVKYIFSNEKGERCTLSFFGGSLLKVKSNNGNDRIICVAAEKFASGLEKEVYRIKWQCSIKENGSIAYKKEPNYIWASYSLEKQQGKDSPLAENSNALTEKNKFLSEIRTYKLLHPKTKNLCEIKTAPSQYGFMAPYLGVDLVKVAESEEYYEREIAEIAIRLIGKFRDLLIEHGMVHCDLKLENVCYDDKKKLVNFIDPDCIVPIDGFRNKRPGFTYEYLSKFLFNEKEGVDKINLLCLGEYRIIHSLWALVATCARVITGQWEIEEDKFLAYLNEIDTYFQMLEDDSEELTEEKLISDTRQLALNFVDGLEEDIRKEYNLLSPLKQPKSVLVQSSSSHRDEKDKCKKRKREEAFISNDVPQKKSKTIESMLLSFAETLDVSMLDIHHDKENIQFHKNSERPTVYGQKGPMLFVRPQANKSSEKHFAMTCRSKI